MTLLFWISVPRNSLGNSAYRRLWIFWLSLLSRWHWDLALKIPQKIWCSLAGLGSRPSLAGMSRGWAEYTVHVCCELPCPGLSYDHLYILLVFYDTNLGSVQWVTLKQFIAGCPCCAEKWLGLKAGVLWAQPCGTQHLIFIRRCSWTIYN